MEFFILEPSFRNFTIVRIILKIAVYTTIFVYTESLLIRRLKSLGLRVSEMIEEVLHMSSVVTHIGLALPDLDRAIDWYCKVFGFYILAGPYESDNRNEQHFSMTQDLRGLR